VGSCNSLDLIDAEKSDSYFLEAGKVVFCQGGKKIAFGSKKCDADINSLEILSRFIIKDNKGIYFKGIRQSHVDYESFHVDNEIPKDKNNAYIGAKTKLEVIPNVDAASYSLVKQDSSGIRWTKDKNSYYRALKKMHVDYNSFEFLNGSFSRDKDSIYAWMLKLSQDKSKKQANAFKAVTKFNDSVLVVNEAYIIASDTLFYIAKLKNNALKKLDVPSKDEIRSLNKHIIIVDNVVVFKGEMFKYKDVDSETFELLDPNYAMKYARDKNYIYFEQEVIDQANPKSFTVLEKSFFGIDEQHVYYKKEIIKGDPKSFRKEKNHWKDDSGNKYSYKGIKQD